MEPNCVSINFGPSHGGKYKCELNSATDDHLTVLEEKPAFTFLAIELNSLKLESRYFLQSKKLWIAAAEFRPSGVKGCKCSKEAKFNNQVLKGW